MTRASRRIATMAAAALVLSGWAGGTATPEKGAVLTVSATAPTTMLPNTVFGAVQITGSGERYAVYDALAIMRTDGTVEHRIARAIEPGDSPGVWTIRLRPGVKFSDGTPLNAEAVRYNWLKMADPRTAAVQSTVAKSVKAMKALDEVTLEVRLAEPDAHFDRLVATSALAFVGSPSAWEKQGVKFATSPVGAGSFVMKEWVDGSHMRLTRNAAFYGDRPPVAEVVFRYIEDETSAYSSLQAGDIDVQTGASAEVAAQAEASGHKLLEVGSSGGAILQLNTTAPPFDDVRARTAVALAFDHEAMNAAVYGGRGKPVDTLFAEGSPLRSEVALRPSPDESRAQRLFDELAADGKPVKFKITMFAKVDGFAEWLVARLASFGNVSASIEVVGRPAALKAYQTGSFQANLQVGTRFVEPEPQLSGLFGTGGSQNYGRYSNPKVDAALKAARTSKDDAGRKAAYERVQRALAEDLPALYYTRLSTRHLFDGGRLASLPVLSDGLLDLPRIKKNGR